MGNIAVVQAGGPTSVLNSSLAGFIEECKSDHKNQQILGFQNGIEGMVKGWTLELSGISDREIQALKRQPGAVLGSGRYPLTEERMQLVKNVLREKKIDQLVFIGGNGTMWSANQIAAVAPEVQIVGIPKTIDNDIWFTDHAPGYLSAAKFVAEGVRSLAFDLWSMRNFERVRIVEVMGRNVGWLAAAAALTRKKIPGFLPIEIYPPEKAFSIEKFVARIKMLLKTEPCVLVVVSEGVKDDNDAAIADQRIGGDESNTIPGGVGVFLANVLRQQGVSCRSENFGVLQRSNTWTVAKRDREEAIYLGQKAYDVLKQGENKVMVGLKGPGLDLRGDAAHLIQLAKVASKERALEPRFLTENGIADCFAEWLELALVDPLIEENSALRVWKLAACQ
ncbi:diphosphate--fructose-6-phosphate 1-phosphotransferase [Desulfitobacterium sp.]|uniref:diphosphate--fructose-6-phosphate 1-phosphotransferase n=1 Tax=Desulfitobacterium sp. TaxID=49981 RepID=UPI002B1EDB25|nr:diphosphate--fructose-6-phosphate 1-phosphotransferase [Desulfitobacterium sp.]MEA4900685.1 diphosphate--fructose-6-phosphate 1-phosphotransferase [Desulfitobacterium sp.]